jgi:zinc protease
MFDEATITRRRLPNGLTVLVREDHRAPVAAVVTYVRAGYFDETDDIVGISHVLEHMYFKGTPTRGVGEIARQTKASGGYLNAATIYDHTRYYAVLPAARFEQGLEIQADAYARSLIDADELRRELEVIIEEAKRKLDNPDAVTTETLFALLHDRHRIRRWRIGHESGLRALTRDQLVGFYRNFYRPSNTILVVAGDVRPDHTLSRIEELYGSLPDTAVVREPGEDEEALPGQRYRELSGDLRSTHFAFGWRTQGPLHADAPALEVAATVLGSGRASRLYRAVRDRQLATSVSAYDYTPTALGVFVVEGEAPTETAFDAAREAWGQVVGLRHGVEAAEVARAQRVLEARWLQQFEAMDGQANFLAEWEALGDWRLGVEVAARTMAVTADDVARAAARYLVPDQASLVIYRPQESAVVGQESTPSEIFERLASAGAVIGGIATIDVPTSRGAAAPPRSATVEGGVSVIRTPRGLPVLAKRRPGAPLAHLGVFVLGGTLREASPQSGVANLMARLTVKGTTKRNAEQLALASESLGGSIAPVVTGDGIGWSLSVPNARLREAVGLLADVVLRPTFPADALETERAIARAQLAQLRDDMARYPLRLALAAAFGDHAYGRSILGDEETLNRLDRDAVRQWHGRHVLAGGAMVAVVSDHEPDAAAALMSEAFDELAGADRPVYPRAPWSGGAIQRVETREKAQTALAMLFPSAPRDDETRHTARILATIASGLGGRFFEALRDRRSLAYTVSVAAADRLTGGHLTAYIATSPSKEEEARAGLLQEFARFREAPVTARELADAKTYGLGTRAIAQQHGATVLADIVDAWLYGNGLSELDEFEARIRDVTAAGIQSYAQQYLEPGARVEGVVRGETRGA